MDDRQLGLLEELDKWTTEQPTKVVFTFLDDNGTEVEKLTYKDLADKTTEIARYLLREDREGPKLESGDRIMLVYEPCLDFIVAFIACLRARLVPVPVYPPALNQMRQNTLDNFQSIQANCEAKVALTTNKFNLLRKAIVLKDRFSSNAAQWPEMTWIASDQILPSVSRANMLGNIFKAKVVAAETESLPLPEDSSVAFLQYTSGSTADPKGVMLTHRNVAHNLTLIVENLNASPDTIVVSWLPQYHDMGLIGAYLGIIKCGGSGYYMSPLSFIKNPVLWIRMIAKYKGTHMQAPNFAYGLAAKKFSAMSTKPPVSELDLSCVQHMINGAEPVDLKTIQSFNETFKPYGLAKNGQVLFPTYGLAEHCVFVCTNGKQILHLDKYQLEFNNTVVPTEAPDGGVNETKDSEEEHTATHTVSTLIGCGFPPPEVEVAIVDPDEGKLTRLGLDKVGEVWLKSHSKAAGYFKMEEKTQQEFFAEIKGEQPTTGNRHAGYLRTGDLGFLHLDPETQKNELFICGRSKDLIIIRGRNVYPQDVEKSVETALPELLRPGCSAAFSVSRDGHEYMVFVCEVRTGVLAEKYEEIVSTIKQTVSTEHGESPAHIVLLPQGTIPKTTSGKISRSKCKEALLVSKLTVLHEDASTAYLESTPQQKAAINLNSIATVSAAEINQMDEGALVKILTEEFSKISSLALKDLKDITPLIYNGVGSLDVAQYAGIVNHKFSLEIPDEYFFRTNTTLRTLAGVIRNHGVVPAPDTNSAAAPQQEVDTLAVQCPCCLGCRRIWRNLCRK